MSFITAATRITPAYAGKRANNGVALSRAGDHPRVCGEKPRSSSALLALTGSPPRMRGKDFFLFYRLFAQRITPAYAGKRLNTKLPRGHFQDHPRVCGEKRFSVSLKLPELGSPPRMRGKAKARLSDSPRPRITPAYAGKRAFICFQRFQHRDHPRVCGEKRKPKALTSKQKGSPPRMRGKASGAGFASVPLRITPAYAGKSCFSSCSYGVVKDHPRVCGEKTKKIP